MRSGCLRFSISSLVVIIFSHLPSPTLLGILYGVSEIFLAITKRSGRGTVSRDRRSLYLLWVVIALSIFLARFTVTIPWGRLPQSSFLAFVGLLLFLGGVALRWYSIFYLGRFFTVNVSIATGHELIDTGPYRFVRHPSYTGALLAFVGFGLSLGSWLTLLCLIVPITAVFLWRIRVEENALREGLGDPYRQYMLRTKRLIPFLY
jgi:protein-S-isoprenylcysteine O-methyltransferase